MAARCPVQGVGGDPQSCPPSRAHIQSVESPTGPPFTPVKAASPCPPRLGWLPRGDAMMLRLGGTPIGDVMNKTAAKLSWSRLRFQ